MIQELRRSNTINRQYRKISQYVCQPNRSPFPISRPYELPIVTITIGHTKYGIPGNLLQDYPKLTQDPTQNPHIALVDVDEDVGHTLVHFLYSGSYETIDLTLMEGTYMEREYQRSLLVYQASRTYNIPNLGELAKKYIEHFDKVIPVYGILQATGRVFPKMPKDEEWLPNYIKKVLRRALLSCKMDFKLSEALKGCDEYDDPFSLTVMAMMVEILSMQTQRLAKGLPI